MARSTYQRIFDIITAPNNNLSRIQREALKNILDGLSPFPTIPITVNYDKSIEQLIADGFYVRPIINDIISQNFPSTEKGTTRVEILLINFKTEIGSKDVIKELNSFGLRPATLKEILTLGSYQVFTGYTVALGSQWDCNDGYCYVPTIKCTGKNFRSVNLCDYDGDWYPSWYFAAVRA